MAKQSCNGQADKSVVDGFQLFRAVQSMNMQSSKNKCAEK